jgi:hypothetical protein
MGAEPCAPGIPPQALCIEAAHQSMRPCAHYETIGFDADYVDTRGETLWDELGRRHGSSGRSPAIGSRLPPSGF